MQGLDFRYSASRSTHRRASPPSLLTYLVGISIASGCAGEAESGTGSVEQGAGFAAELPVDGDPSLYPTSEDKVVGGDRASGEVRYFAMTLEERGGQHYRGVCGASLIGRQWAITAAHCLSNFRKNDLLDKMDALYLNPDNPWQKDASGEVNNGRRYQVATIAEHFEHPLHEPGSASSYDVALLKLAEPVDDYFTPVPVADASYIEELVRGTDCTVYGMGKTGEAAGKSTYLQQADVEYVPPSQCREVGDQKVDETMLCAGGDGKTDACGGDSGGPLVQDGVLIGVVSWGVGCARKDLPGVYARPSHVLDWIRSFDIDGLRIRSAGGSANESPSASFEADVDELAVDFADTSSDDGHIVSWQWDFGDGATSAQESPHHEYQQAGTYVVSLTVTDDAGATGSASMQLSVEQVDAGYAVSSQNDFSNQGQVVQSFDTLYLKLWNSLLDPSRLQIRQMEVKGVDESGAPRTVTDELSLADDGSFRGEVHLDGFAPGSWVQVFGEVRDADGHRQSLGGPYGGYRVWIVGQGYEVSRSADASSSDPYFYTSDTLYVRVWDTEVDASRLEAISARVVGIDGDGAALTLSGMLTRQSDGAFLASFDLSAFQGNHWIAVYAHLEDSAGQGYRLNGYRAWLIAP